MHPAFPGSLPFLPSLHLKTSVSFPDVPYNAPHSVRHCGSAPAAPWHFPPVRLRIHGMSWGFPCSVPGSDSASRESLPPVHIRFSSLQILFLHFPDLPMQCPVFWTHPPSRYGSGHIPSGKYSHRVHAVHHGRSGIHVPSRTAFQEVRPAFQALTEYPRYEPYSAAPRPDSSRQLLFFSWTSRYLPPHQTAHGDPPVYRLGSCQSVPVR